MHKALEQMNIQLHKVTEEVDNAAIPRGHISDPGPAPAFGRRVDGPNVKTIDAPVARYLVSA